LENIQKNTKGIAYMYFVTPDNAMYSVPNDGDLSKNDWTSRDWYKDAMKRPGNVVWSEPYLDSATNVPLVTASKTVKVHGNIVGVLGVDVTLETLKNLTNSTKIGKTGFYFLLDKQGNLLTYPNETKNLGKNLLSPSDKESENFTKTLPYIKNIYDKDNGVLNVKINGKEKIVVFSTNKTTGWKLVFTADKDDLFGISSAIDSMGIQNEIQITKIEKIRTNLIIVFLLTGLIIVVLGGFLAYYLSNNIAKRIKKLENATELISGGDLTQTIETRNNDEIDQLGAHFNKMSINLRELVEANIKLTNQIDQSANNLAAVSEEATAQVSQISYNIEEIADSATKQAIEVSEASYEVEHFASFIQNMNNFTTNVDSSILNTAGISRQGKNIMEKLQQTSQNNLLISNEVSENIKTLSEQMKRIISFTSTIKAISEQTNLLALNASIEAARAGDFGKGFMVVADEVKKLAEESANSANEIDSIISNIHTQVELSEKNINKTEFIVKEQHEIVFETKEAFLTIENSIEQITKQMVNVKNTMENLNESKDSFLSTIRNISATTEETAVGAKNVVATSKEQISAIDDLSQSAQELKEMTISLNEQIKKFKI
jgi:methyl-accepting chemotaxis protein